MWLSCTSELYHLAWEALRRPRGAPLGTGVGKGFAETTPPVSREFIEQRADIDEPQLGYLVRRADTGWLQGFAWATTFTNWTHYFKWDSLASQSGLRRPGAGDAGRTLDADGSLAEALEAQPRHGDPDVSGVVWPTVAEVALVGGLGCGSFLLRLLLETLEKEGTYQFVVLQATNNSVSFYQRHGFVRVGAVARYSRRPTGGAAEVVGYRHWLATDEELHPSDKPSYMMALRLQPRRGAAAKQPKPGSLLAKLPALVPKRLPAVMTTPVPSDLLHASAAVDALAAGAIDRARALLEQAGGALAEPQEDGDDVPDDTHAHDGDAAQAQPGTTGSGATAPAASAPAVAPTADGAKKSRGGVRPASVPEHDAAAAKKALKAAKAKAAAQRRAADRKAGLPPRPRGRPRGPTSPFAPLAAGGGVATTQLATRDLNGPPLAPPTPPDEVQTGAGPGAGSGRGMTGVKRPRQPTIAAVGAVTQGTGCSGRDEPQHPPTTKKPRPPPRRGTRQGLRSNAGVGQSPFGDKPAAAGAASGPAAPAVAAKARAAALALAGHAQQRHHAPPVSPATQNKGLWARLAGWVSP